ncbi:MAG: DUF6445 family protein [Methylophilaceae bacterium]
MMNLYPVTVVENFYENPDAIRQFALAQEYTFCHDRENLEYVYPGSRTKDIFDLDKTLHEKIVKKLISVFHNSEHDVMRWAVSTNFQAVSEGYEEGVIHTDENTIFAAVLFLTPNPPLNSGTSLFRKSKNFDQARYDKAVDENDIGFRAGDIVMNTSYHDMFDEIVRVNNVYNTLILYEGRHFHAANKFFGKNLKNSRLAQVFFINKIDAQKHSVFPIKRVGEIKL